MPDRRTIAVVGGGAAGLAAAVAAGQKLARRGRAREAAVVVYEADERVGRSILATGNGRCNFSNANISPRLYRNARFASDVLSWFEAAACSCVSSQAKRSTAYGNGVLGFFSDCGLVWREEAEGRLYPLANKATSVLNVLRAALDAAGVDVRCNSAVRTVEPPREEGGRFTLRLSDGRFERADAVIVAVGGAITRGLLPEGVSVRAVEPVLGPLATETRWTRPLDNIRVKGALELWRPARAGMSPQRMSDGGYLPGSHEDEKLVVREQGEVMFRKYGISGIAAFNVSRLAKPGDVAAIDFLPWIRAVDATAFLNRRRKLLHVSLGRDVTWDDMLCGMVLAPVASVLLEAAGLCGGAAVQKGETSQMAMLLKGLRLPVTGLGDVRQCQVHRGGVAVGEVDARACEVRAHPGLHVVGEALDVDAPCGGYNLHWAWASGLLAGWGAADGLFGEDGGEDARELAGSFGSSAASLPGSSGPEPDRGAPCSNSPRSAGMSTGHSRSLRNCARTPLTGSGPARSDADRSFGFGADSSRSGEGDRGRRA